MQTETIDKNQQATPSIDEELIDTLIAISVVAKRLAANLRQQNTENGGKQDDRNLNNRLNRNNISYSLSNRLFHNRTSYQVY